VPSAGSPPTTVQSPDWAHTALANPAEPVGFGSASNDRVFCDEPPGASGNLGLWATSLRWRLGR
jgi:hypothetical protein